MKTVQTTTPTTKGANIMTKRNRIVFHRGYNILASKYGTFRPLPLNVITIAGLKQAAEAHGYSYMYSSHPEFSTFEECAEYIDKNFK